MDKYASHHQLAIAIEAQTGLKTLFLRMRGGLGAEYQLNSPVTDMPICTVTLYDTQDDGWQMGSFSPLLGNELFKRFCTPR